MEGRVAVGPSGSTIGAGGEQALHQGQFELADRRVGVVADGGDQVGERGASERVARRQRAGNRERALEHGGVLLREGMVDGLEQLAALAGEQSWVAGRTEHSGEQGGLDEGTDHDWHDSRGGRV